VRSSPQEWPVRADTKWIWITQRGRAGENGEEIVERMRGGSQIWRTSGSVHSLKALAGLYGFDPIRRRAHPLEKRLCGGKSASSGLRGRRASEE
jgi:hypothetical protein